MSIGEKLKKAQKKAKTLLVTGALTIAAIVTPIKGEAAEAAPEKDPTKTSETQKAQKVRQHQLEQAVRSGAPKEEIAKYIDFPEFIPTTKDGKFNQKKAEEWSKKLAPYLKALTEKGEALSAAEAYKAFKEATGQTDISLEDFKRVCDIAGEAVNSYGTKWKSIAAGTSMMFLFAGVALLSGLAAKELAGEAKDSFFFCKERMMGMAQAAGAAGLAALSGFLTLGSAGAGLATYSTYKTTPEREIRLIYKDMYNSHVDNTIEAQQKQFQILELNQAKQLIKNIQGRK